MEHHYLHNLSPFLVELGAGLGVRWYGLSYVLAFLLGSHLLGRLAARSLVPVPVSGVGDFITWAALFGVLLGGRLGYVLLYDFPRFVEEPLCIFRVWEGGMASHGGILGLMLYTLYYARKHSVAWTAIGDGLVCVAPPGLFLVRIANFINGELYGRPTRVPWAVQFPSELREHPQLLDGTPFSELSPEAVVHFVQSQFAGAPAGLEAALRSVLPARHPSQVYEALLEGPLLFLILWLLRTRLRLPNGVVTGAFFVFYALLRILGEQFRQPEDFNFGMPRGVFLSLFMIGIGLAFAASGWRRAEYLQPRSAGDDSGRG